MRKWAMGLMAAGGAVGALAFREAMQRRQDIQVRRVARSHWRQALASEDLRWADAAGLSYRIPSNKVGIHLDVYAQPASQAPVVVLAHGLVTYSKYLIPLAHQFFDRGYSVVCPDLGGNGYSGGIRGGQTVGEAAAALVDTTIWARERFDGPITLLGVSLGGALAYAAAAAGAPVSAISCLDLFTFDDPRSLKELMVRPTLAQALLWLRPLEPIIGWIRLPVPWIHRFAASVAAEEAAQLQRLMSDPLPPRQLTLRALISAVSTPPAVAPEHNTIPTLVLNQECDRVLAPSVTRMNFARLGGPKRYVELRGMEHWSLKPGFWAPVVTASDLWFREHAPKSTPALQRA